MGKYKEFTDFSTVQLIDNYSGNRKRSVSRNDKEGRRGVINFVGNDMKGYVDGYIIGFQRQYRRRLHAQYLKKMGFLPQAAQTKKFDTATLAAAMGYDSIITFRRIGVPETKKPAYGGAGMPGGSKPKAPTHANLKCEASSFLRVKYGSSWDHDAQVLTVGGVTWSFTSVTKPPAIGNNPCDDGSGFGGSKFPNCHVITLTDSSGNKKTEIFGQKTTGSTGNMINTTPGKDVVEIAYKKGGKSHCYVDWYDNLPSNAFITSTMYFTPIITLKENDHMLNLNEKKTKHLLGKLGVEPGDLMASLQYKCDNENWEGPFTDAEQKDWKRFDKWKDGDARIKHPGYKGRGAGMGLDPANYIRPPDDGCPKDQKKASDVDNAYMYIGVYPASLENGNLALLFQFFDAFSNDEETNIRTGLGNFSVEYVFSAKKTSTPGRYMSIGGAPLKNGKYAKSIMVDTENDDGGYGGFIGFGSSSGSYVKQIDDTRYETIIVSKYQQKTIVSHRGKERVFRGSLGEMSPKKDSGDTREEAGRKVSFILCPLDIYNDLSYREWLNVYENGFSLGVYAYKRVKLKWYQRGIWKVVIFVVAAILAVWTGGQSITLAAVVTQLVINLAVMIVVQIVVAVTGSEALAAIAAIVVMVFTGQITIDINFLTSFQGFLMMATQLTNILAEMKMDARIAELASSKEELEKMKEENEEKMALIDDSAGPQNTLFIGDHSMLEANETPGGMQTPQEYFAVALGANQYNYDYLYDVDAQYAKRKNVKT